MEYRSFGRAGWRVSAIGLGAWGMGGGWGAVDDGTSIATLLYAWEHGINFVDTAQMYGSGHSEQVIGRALKQWTGDKIYVATKVQPIQWPSPNDDAPPMRGRYPAWYLREQVEACLTRLGVERIDLLQLHCWLDAGCTELDWLETLNALRLEGKVDRIGGSLRDNRPGEGVGAARLGLLDAQQVVFNLFDQRAGDELFRVGEASATAFIARVPLDSSSLVGHWTPETYATWDEGDVRKVMFRGERFGETLQRVEALKELCAPYFPTLAEAALRFVLSDPGVAVVIPGMKTREEVDLNLACSDGRPFPDALKAQLLAHRWARNFYT